MQRAVFYGTCGSQLGRRASAARLKKYPSPQPQPMSIERSSGDLSRSFVGGTMQHVDDGLKARDGRIYLFVAADWEDQALDIKPFVVSKHVSIPVTCVVRENLLMCSCIIVMQGKQCGPLHLALVAHCREWLWSKTTPQMSRRDVEGSGLVDYVNIMWSIDSELRLYRNVTSNVGMCQHRAESGGFWDGCARAAAHASRKRARAMSGMAARLGGGRSRAR